MKRNRIYDFILENQDLINAKSWKTIYDNAYDHETFSIGKLTRFLLECGIDPLAQSKSNSTFQLYFEGDTLLQSWHIPDNIVKLEEETFLGCTSLMKIIFNDKLQEIGDFCFQNTYQLKNIDIPNTVTKIGKYAFCSSSIESIFIPDSIDRIQKGTFRDCAFLKFASIPDNIILENGVFDECSRLDTLEVRGSIKNHALRWSPTALGDANIKTIKYIDGEINL